MYYDKKQLIQNSNNIPIIYHTVRHKANKALDFNIPDERLSKYSIAIPDVDKHTNHRNKKKYWWLKNDQQRLAIHNPKITKILEEVFTGARSVTWCTRLTECGLTPFIHSSQPNNNENSRRRFHRCQIGDLVHQVDGMWQSNLQLTALNNP
ncbi:hypothetical protein TKK_0010033 [Trichogramma kaykai]